MLGRTPVRQPSDCHLSQSGQQPATHPVLSHYTVTAAAASGRRHSVALANGHVHTPHMSVAFAHNYTAHLASCNALPSPIVLSKALEHDAVLQLDADRIHQAKEWEAIQCALMGEARTHPTATAALRAIRIFSRAGKACAKDIEKAITQGYAAPLVAPRFYLRTKKSDGQVVDESSALSNGVHRTHLFQGLRECLAWSQHLTELSLNGLPLKLRDLEQLGHGVGAATTLKKLSLSRTAIGSRGLKTLLPFLKENVSLEYLDLSACDLDAVSMSSIADLLMLQALRHSDACWERSLRTTHDYDDEATVRNRPMVGLKRINLSLNPIGSTGVVLLLDTMRRHGAIQGLDLLHVGADDRILEACQSTLEEQTRLLHLDLRRNDLSSETMDVIGALLARNQGLYDTSFLYHMQPVHEEVPLLASFHLPPPNPKNDKWYTDALRKKHKQKEARPPSSPAASHKRPAFRPSSARPEGARFKCLMGLSDAEVPTEADQLAFRQRSKSMQLPPPTVNSPVHAMAPSQPRLRISTTRSALAPRSSTSSPSLAPSTAAQSAAPRSSGIAGPSKKQLANLKDESGHLGALLDALQRELKAEAQLRDGRSPSPQPIAFSSLSSPTYTKRQEQQSPVQEIMTVLQSSLHEFQDMLTDMKRKQDAFIASASASLPTSPVRDAKKDVPKFEEMARLLKLKQDMEAEYHRSSTAAAAAADSIKAAEKGQSEAVASSPTLTERMLALPAVTFDILPDQLAASPVPSTSLPTAVQPSPVPATIDNKATSSTDLIREVQESERRLAAKREEMAQYMTASRVDESSRRRNPLKQALMVNTLRQQPMSPGVASSLRDDATYRTRTPSNATSYRSMSDYEFVEAYRQHQQLQQHQQHHQEPRDTYALDALADDMDHMALSPRDAMMEHRAMLA